MKRIVLLSGIKSQKNEPCPAKDLYKEKVFKQAWELAGYVAADAVYILTKEHHVVEPDKILSPYEENLIKSTVSERKAWAKEVLKALEAKGYDLSQDHFILYGREKFIQFLIGDEGIKHYRWLNYQNESYSPVERELKYLNRSLTKHIEISEEKSAFYDVSKLKTIGDFIKLLAKDETLKVHFDGCWYDPEGINGIKYDSMTEEQIIERCDKQSWGYRDSLYLAYISPERITHEGCKFVPPETEKEESVMFTYIYIS